MVMWHNALLVRKEPNLVNSIITFPPGYTASDEEIQSLNEGSEKVCKEPFRQAGRIMASALLEARPKFKHQL